MRVMWWAADRQGQGFWRMQVPAYAMNARGHEVHVSQVFTPQWQADAEAVVGARTLEPQPSKVWARLAAEGRTMVLDVDDDYLNVDPTNVDAFRYFSRYEVRDALIRNMGLATRITCVSQRLADTYAQYGPTVVVPNGLPAEVLDWPARPPRDGRVVLGWAGSSSTLPELALIARRVRRFLDRHPQVEVHTVGCTVNDIWQVGLRHPRVRVTPWTTPGYPYLKTIDFDVWLAPYRPTEFNRCKAATKAIEAAFLGVPIVASAIEPYEQFIDHGATGYTVTRDHEWDTYLAALLDPHQRAAMGAAAKVQAAGHTAEHYADLWEQTVGATAGVAT